jgi:drug/metabolite transporter (DMT)-like permease
MRSAGIAGIVGAVLIVLGIVVLLGGGRFTTKRDVVKIGDLKVTADDHRTIPVWAAGLGIAAGAVLLFSGARRKA